MDIKEARFFKGFTRLTADAFKKAGMSAMAVILLIGFVRKK